MTVGEACLATFCPTRGFKGRRTLFCHLLLLNSGDLNFCVRNITMREGKLRQPRPTQSKIIRELKKERKKKKKKEKRRWMDRREYRNKDKGYISGNGRSMRGYTPVSPTADFKGRTFVSPGFSAWRTLISTKKSIPARQRFNGQTSNTGDENLDRFTVTNKTPKNQEETARQNIFWPSSSLHNVIWCNRRSDNLREGRAPWKDVSSPYCSFVPVCVCKGQLPHATFLLALATGL